MGRPVRSFPCRSICYPPLPLAQHPQHAAEVLFSASTAHSFGSLASASTTFSVEAQQSSEQLQHVWNANSLPSTLLHRIAYLGLDRATQTLQLFWSPWIPIGKSSLVFEAVGLPRYRPPQELSLLVRSCGVGRGLSAIYQVFQLYYPLMNFPGTGVALTALELLHLVSTFVLRGRGLLNLLHLRSDRLSTSSPTRSSSFSTVREYENAGCNHANCNHSAATGTTTTVPVFASSVVSLTATCNIGFWGSV